MPETAPTPVAFEFGPASSGWIGLTVRAGEASDRISCSEVYDPFPELVAWMTTLMRGQNGAVEIDEEGRATFIWLDREPGSYLGRLRVFEPGANGEVEVAHVDATVDIVQMAHAFHQAFSAYVATYDARHWDQRDVTGETVVRTLAGIDMRNLSHCLEWMAVIPDARGDMHERDTVAYARAAYQAELGAACLPAVATASAPPPTAEASTP